MLCVWKLACQWIDRTTLELAIGDFFRCSSLFRGVVARLDQGRRHWARSRIGDRSPDLPSRSRPESAAGDVWQPAPPTARRDWLGPPQVPRCLRARIGPVPSTRPSQCTRGDQRGMNRRKSRREGPSGRPRPVGLGARRPRRWAQRARYRPTPGRGGPSRGLLAVGLGARWPRRVAAAQRSKLVRGGPTPPSARQHRPGLPRPPPGAGAGLCPPTRGPGPCLDCWRAKPFLRTCDIHIRLS